jgi:hypothetical protein
MDTEFEKLQKILDSDYQLDISTPKKKCRFRNPVTKLSDALNRYKTERIGSEDDLIKCI